MMLDEELLAKLVHGLIVIEIGPGINPDTHVMSETAFHVTTISDQPIIDHPADKFRIPDNVERLTEVPQRWFHIAFINNVISYQKMLTTIASVKAPRFIINNCLDKEIERAIEDCNLTLVEDFKTKSGLRLYER